MILTKNIYGILEQGEKRRKKMIIGTCQSTGVGSEKYSSTLSSWQVDVQ